MALCPCCKCYAFLNVLFLAWLCRLEGVPGRKHTQCSNTVHVRSEVHGPGATVHVLPHDQMFIFQGLDASTRHCRSATMDTPPVLQQVVAGVNL